MAEKTPHEFAASKGAALRLADHLAQPGWFTGTVQAYRGGALAETLQCELDAPDRTLVQAEGEDHAAFARRADALGKRMKAWGTEPFSRGLTDAERDVARACIKKFAAEGKLQLDAAGVALLKALGLDAEG